MAEVLLGSGALLAGSERRLLDGRKRGPPLGQFLVHHGNDFRAELLQRALRLVSGVEQLVAALRAAEVPVGARRAVDRAEQVQVADDRGRTQVEHLEHRGLDVLVGDDAGAIDAAVTARVLRAAHDVQVDAPLVEQQRLHHAYLFTGTRGVGKTTLSRILAKSLNCVGADGQGGITAQPCGVCRACTEIDAGRFVDYIEMDAASNRGVDEMAQLLDRAVYAPTVGRFKVYMIDEVHMLTNHAFNAMLKTLEEPPEHVKFILATTDPQKIPVTVLSRCLQFNLKQMPPGHIVGHLENILGQEGVSFEQPALRLLAQGAHGSMRDALSLTDQAIAYAAGAVTLDAVQGMLGALDQSYLVRLLDALAGREDDFLRLARIRLLLRRGDPRGALAVASEAPRARTATGRRRVVGVRGGRRSVGDERHDVFSR